MSNKILERRYYVLDVKLLSPMNVSSGNNKLTDIDIIRNADGKVFVPGTSLAGVFRNYFGQKKESRLRNSQSLYNQTQVTTYTCGERYSLVSRCHFCSELDFGSSNTAFYKLCITAMVCRVTIVICCVCGVGFTNRKIFVNLNTTRCYNEEIWLFCCILHV